MTVQVEKEDYFVYIKAKGAGADEIISLLERESDEVVHKLACGGGLSIEYEGQAEIGRRVVDYILKMLNGAVLCKVENIDRVQQDYDYIYIVEVLEPESRSLYLVHERYVTFAGVGFVDISFLSSAYTTPR